MFYQNPKLIAEDAKFFAEYPNVTICAREQYSYDFIKKHFNVSCLMLPDMAFFIDLRNYTLTKEQNRILFLKRIDKELASESAQWDIPGNAEVHDWPTYEYRLKQVDRVEKLFYKVYRLMTILKFKDKYVARLDDWKRKFFYRKFYVQLGINFLSPYSMIYTTRLHVLILGVLLDKKIRLINNTSGKVVNFYNTWLKELEKVEV